MEAISIDFLEEFSDSLLRFLPFIITVCISFPLVKFLFSRSLECSSSDIDIFTKPDIEEVKEPEKPKETVVKTYVINSPVKMQPVTKAKEVPKFCPYCAGIPDNDERCSYCGIKF